MYLSTVIFHLAKNCSIICIRHKLNHHSGRMNHLFKRIRASENNYVCRAFTCRRLQNMRQWFLPLVCSEQHPVDMRVIHLKLPNEKQNEAILTERTFCRREGEQDGRWPIVSNVISVLMDGFPVWVSCTRASGCLQSYRIHGWLLGEPPHRRTHMRW